MNSESFMLLNCPIGNEVSIIKAVVKLSRDIKVVRGTYGVHDIVVKIKSKDALKMDELIRKVRKVPGVTSTTTLTVISEQGGKG